MDRSELPHVERQLRIQLAAAYRISHYYGWDELIYNHITVRIPGPESHFLINPFGLAFDEVTASNLVKVNLDGETIGESPYPINPAGYVIHSAIHGARDDAHCVVHLHSPSGIAVAALEEGLPFHTQNSLPLFGRIAYHDYEGFALNLEERARLIDDLGDKKLMILRNHGLLTIGANVAEAMSNMFWLDRACQVELLALNTQRPLRKLSTEVLNSVARQATAFDLKGGLRTSVEFAAMQRRVERLDPGYKE